MAESGQPGGGGGPEQAQADLGRSVSALEKAVYSGMAQELTPLGLTPLDIQLMAICLEEQECTASHLAQLLPVEASRISRLVTGLSDRGLLRRRRLRNDRRMVMLRLSPEGERLATEVLEHLQVYYARLTDGLSERELRAFAATAQRIVANSQAMQE